MPNNTSSHTPHADFSLTKFCGELRSKKYFMLETIPTDESHYMDPSGHCWCHHTQQPVGPDGRHVTPASCGPGRKCYRSALATG